MTRLLMVTTVPAALRAFLLPFAEHFTAKGWRVDAMAHGVSSCPECVEAFDHVWEVSWTRNPLDLRGLLRSARTIREVVQREGYEIVHVHTPVAAFVARFALRGLRASGRPRVVYTAHGFHFHRGGHPLANIAFRMLERRAGRWTDALVVVNREDEAAAIRHRIVEPGRVAYTAGIGIDTDHYSPALVSEAEVQAVRRSLGLSTGPLFLQIGEFVPNKRQRVAVEALARLPGVEAHLAFAGTGPRLEEVRREVERLGLSDRVHFLGQRRDIAALIRASTAVISVSGREGLPRNVMEALSLEVPVVGTDVRGTRDLLAGGGGILVPVDDPGRLAEALEWILGHPAEALAMARAGRSRMAGDYRLPAILEGYEAIYAAALEGEPSHPTATARRPISFALKRVVDVVGAAVGLVVLAPVLGAVGGAIALTMGRPVLFRQARAGYRSRTFEVVKFRTMREAFGPDGRPLDDSERVTRLGRFLRASSLDELPQLWNVLKGDVSLVGPRPLLAQYVPLYNRRQARRHEVKPGITGWAQVHGRNAIDWEERFCLDLWYVENWSLWLDLKILALTVLKVCRRDGISARGAATMPLFRGTVGDDA